MVTVLGKVFKRHSSDTQFYSSNIGNIGTFVYHTSRDRWRIVVFKISQNYFGKPIRNELGRMTITGFYNALKQAVEQMKKEVDYVSGRR